MKNFPLDTETEKRLHIVKQINDYVAQSDLSGLLVTGSLAWGKNSAVTSTSDIDFYLLAPTSDAFLFSLDGVPVIPPQTKEILKKMLGREIELADTKSTKTDVGHYYGSIYLFLEKDLTRLVNELDNQRSRFFKNLRPNGQLQTKEYKGSGGGKMVFTTPATETKGDSHFWIRTDPLFLIEQREFYGSIFLSHILFGDAYTDKHGVIHSAQTRARRFLKSVLPSKKEDAFTAFMRYLPRVERMNAKTINDLFDLVWL